jgi:hypothetical protein
VALARRADTLTVSDVRGSRIDEKGREWFHVYRPVSGAPNAPLVGYEWLRDDPAQRAEATALLVEHVRTTPRPFANRPPSSGYIRFFSRMNACESCHFANKAAGTDPDDWLPLWPTDQIGWYVPQAVMLSALALSSTPSWHDPNAEDDLVASRCRSGAAARRRGTVRRWFQCDDGSVPNGIRDIIGGLADGDTYTRAVCRSRRYIFDRMSPEAKRAFAAAMDPCRRKSASAAAKR